MCKNQNQPLSLNDIGSVKNNDILNITSVTLNELNDVTAGQGITEYYYPNPAQQRHDEELRLEHQRDMRFAILVVETYF